MVAGNEVISSDNLKAALDALLESRLRGKFVNGTATSTMDNINTSYPMSLNYMDMNDAFATSSSSVTFKEDGTYLVILAIDLTATRESSFINNVSVTAFAGGRSITQSIQPEKAITRSLAASATEGQTFSLSSMYTGSPAAAHFGPTVYFTIISI